MSKLLLVLSLIGFGAFAQNANNCKVTTATTVATNSTSSTKVLVANGYRRCLTIANDSDVAVYITFAAGGGATEGIYVAANGYYQPVVPYMGDIYVRSASSSSKSVYVVEGQ